MTRRQLTLGILMMLCMVWSLSASARDIKDTLMSGAGDRVILSYSISHSGGKTTVKFNTVQKKLSEANQRKFKKLDEVAVVIFDRTGTYNDMKFDGMTPSAFMVPAGVTYEASSDGYFLLQDNPTLEFSGSSETQLTIPLFMAHYERKHHYKIFSQCGALQLSTTASGGTRGGGGQQGGGTEVITSEELVDEGMAPEEEALIRMSQMRNMLEMATKVPFPEELTHAYNGLSDLRMKITDQAIGQQVDELLKAYSQKKQELTEQSEEAAKTEKEQMKADMARQQQEQQARQDSIQKASEEKAAKDKKQTMWLIGGIAALGLLLMGGKQVWTTIKNNKMQRMMMENINKAQQQALGGMNIPGADQNPLLKDVNNQLQRESRKTLSKEGEEAKKRLQALRKGNTDTAQAGAVPGNGTAPATKATGVAAGGASAQATPQPKRPSMNDVIPKKYKRWRKPGTPDSNNNNVTI